MKILFSIVSLLLFVGPSAGADFTYQEYTKAPELWKRGSRNCHHDAQSDPPKKDRDHHGEPLPL
jgi:hypothetical protein